MKKLNLIVLIAYLLGTFAVQGMEHRTVSNSRTLTKPIIIKSFAVGVVSFVILGAMLNYTSTIEQPNGPNNAQPKDIAVSSFFMALILALANVHAELREAG